MSDPKSNVQERSTRPNRGFGYQDAIVSHRYRILTAVLIIAVYGSLEAVFTFFSNRLFSVISDQGGLWSEIAAPLAIVLSLWLFQIIISTLSL